MTMKKTINILIPLCLMVVFSNGFSQEHYTYKRKIELKQDTLKWNSVDIPDVLYDKVKPDLSDIRIFGIKDNDTIEVPYLLKFVPNDFEFAMPLGGRIINKSHTDTKYYFTIETDQPNSILNNIKLSFANENFDWKLKLEGSHNQNEWFTILNDYRILSIKNQETDYRFEKLVFDDSRFKFYRISIEADTEPKLKEFFLYGEVQNEKNVFKTFNIKDLSVKNDKKNKQTVIEFSLKNKVPVRSLKLNVNDAFLYHRPIVIEYLADSTKTEKGWIKNYRHFSSGVISSKEKTYFVCYGNLEHITKDFRIIIDNQDNIPLKIDSVDVNVLNYNLIFQSVTDSDLFLYYGNSKAIKPSYDLMKYKSFINETDIKNNTVLSEELVVPKNDSQQQPVFQSKLWLWGIMILIIAILGYFSFKMVSKKD